MLRHTEECRQRGYRFVADPSSSSPSATATLIRPLIDGAHILFSNEYESHLITQKTGWSRDEVLDRVGTWVVTLGADGVRIERKGEGRSRSPPCPRSSEVEPTGVGDAFRAGFLAALAWGLDHERAAQLGCLLAVYVVEQVGTQEYNLLPAELPARCARGVRRRGGRRDRPHLQTLRV